MVRHGAYTLPGQGLWFWLWLLMAALGTSAAEPRRVLLIHSFGREFEPFHTVSESFRSELTRLSPEPVEFVDAALQGVRIDDGTQDGPLLDYVLALFAGHQPDLVVTVGGPAARFAQRHQDRLFPGSPVLIAATDQRHLKAGTFPTNHAVISTRLDLRLVAEDILHLRPATTNIYVVLGNSPLERFWVEELHREFQPLTNRVEFTWLNHLSFDRIKDLAAHPPAHSAFFYALMSIDAKGVTHPEESALTELRSVAQMPIFGIFDYQLGRGIVGGPLTSTRDLSQQAAAIAARLLQGEPPAHFRPPPVAPGPPVYDERELQRWNIQESRLRPGSEVRFREPPLWQRFAGRIVLTLAILVTQGLVIALLLINRARRRRAEQAAREFSGRLLHAQEAERARMARELHDDITQRLARLAIDAGLLEAGRDAGRSSEMMRALREGLVRLSEDVHALSYRLHPALLEDLGLTDALKAECERFSRQESIPVEFRAEPIPGPIPKATGLCLFRVTQEALRNIARHAQAPSAAITLRAIDDGVQLAITDRGIGFNPRQKDRHTSLGLASMRERMRLVDGEIDIESAPNRGTSVVAWAPLNGNPS